MVGCMDFRLAANHREPRQQGEEAEPGRRRNLENVLGFQQAQKTSSYADLKKWKWAFLEYFAFAMSWIAISDSISDDVKKRADIKLRWEILMPTSTPLSEPFPFRQSGQIWRETHKQVDRLRMLEDARRS